MKLITLISVIACSYAAKLDRGYLPPSNAASAGGSPGSLTAPLGGPSGSGSGFGTSGSPGFGSSAGSNGYSQPSGYRPSGGSSSPTRPQFSQAPSGLRPSNTGVASQGYSQGPSGGQSIQGFGQGLNSASSGPSNAGYSQSPSAGGPESSFGQAPSAGQGFGQAPKPTYGAPSANTIGQVSTFSQGNQAAPGSFGQVNQRPQGAFAQANQGQQGSFAPQGSFAQANQEQQGSFAPQGYQQQGPERPQAAADRNAEILRYDNQNDGETFSYSFETSNGIAAEESGTATNGVQAQGGYSYTGDDGQFYKVTYTADENGYVPQGDHLPTPPPIPEEIIRSLEENARAAAAGTQEGAYRPEENDVDSALQYNAGGSASFQKPGEVQPSNVYNQPQSQNNQYNGPVARPQGPSQQNGAPNAFSPSGPAGSSPQPGYNSASSRQFAPSGQFQQGSGFGGPSTSIQSGQSGYQYDRPSSQIGSGSSGPSRPSTFSRPNTPSSLRIPSGSTFGTGSQGTFGASGIQTPSAPAASGGQGSYTPASRPSGQGSIGPAPGTLGQGSFGTAAQPSSRPSTGSQGYPSGRPNSQGPFGATSGSGTFGQYPSGPSGGQSSRPSGPNSFGKGSTGQGSFGASPSAPSNFAGQSSGQYRPSLDTMSGDSGYQYNRPGSNQGQPNFNNSPGFNQSGGQGQFGGSRQPPSFSPEEGYKY